MNKTAAELMNRNVLTVKPEWSVDRLMEFFTNKRISGAPVVGDDNKPIGVVSHTDIARENGGGAGVERNLDDLHRYYRALDDVVAREEIERFSVGLPSRTTVLDIMTPTVFAVEERSSVQEVAEMMITGRIHRVFVKHRGKLTGIITSMDLLPLIREMT